MASLLIDLLLALTFEAITPYWSTAYNAMKLMLNMDRRIRRKRRKRRVEMKLRGKKRRGLG